MTKEEQMLDDLEEPATQEDYPDYGAGFWRTKPREVATVAIDYSLSHLTKLIEKKIINLQPRYQRRYRWSDKRKSKLIESLMMGIPIPPIFLSEDQGGTYSVIDGRQRLLAISEFMSGKLTLSGLEVFDDFNDLNINTLPPEHAGKLENRYTLRAIVVIRETSPHVMLEVFARVNTGGVQLNPQEIRNAMFPCDLNDMIMEVSESPEFHGLLGITNKRKSTIWNTMRDAEFVLRFLTFQHNWQDFPGPLKQNMDTFMKMNRGADVSTVDVFRKEFLSTIAAVKAFFGEHAFRRWNPRRDSWFSAVNSALYDAEMFACVGMSAGGAKGRQAKALDGMRNLFRDKSFDECISRGTNTPEFFRKRITMVRDMLAGIVRG